MKKVLQYILQGIIFITFFSCSSSLPCSNADTQDDNNHLRAFGQGHSRNIEIAREMAIGDAKQKIGEKLQDLCNTKFLNNTVAEDDAYIEKVRIAQKTVMRDIAVTCSRIKKKKGIYYAYVGLDIEIRNLENIIRTTKIKPQETN